MSETYAVNGTHYCSELRVDAMKWGMDFLNVRHAEPQPMREESYADDATLLLVGSTSSFVATPGQPAYGASKGGLVTLVKSLAKAWARDGIRVNGIAPGLVETKTRIRAPSGINDCVSKPPILCRKRISGELINCVLAAARGSGRCSAVLRHPAASCRRSLERLPIFALQTAEGSCDQRWGRPPRGHPDQMR